MRHVVWTLALLAAPAAADPRLAGSYDGVINSYGVDVAGTTVLTVAESGAIGGNYSYLDGETMDKGQLRGCDFADLVLRCTWFDRYGSGALVVRFKSDLGSFEGSWYDNSLPLPHDKPQGGYRWTGTRTPG